MHRYFFYKFQFIFSFCYYSFQPVSRMHQYLFCRFQLIFSFSVFFFFCLFSQSLGYIDTCFVNFSSSSLFFSIFFLGYLSDVQGEWYHTQCLVLLALFKVKDRPFLALPLTYWTLVFYLFQFFYFVCKFIFNFNLICYHILLSYLSFFFTLANLIPLTLFFNLSIFISNFNCCIVLLFSSLLKSV